MSSNDINKQNRIKNLQEKIESTQRRLQSNQDYLQANQYDTSSTQKFFNQQTRKDIYEIELELKDLIKQLKALM